LRKCSNEEFNKDSLVGKSAKVTAGEDIVELIVVATASNVGELVVAPGEVLFVDETSEAVVAGQPSDDIVLVAEEASSAEVIVLIEASGERVLEEEYETNELFEKGSLVE